MAEKSDTKAAAYFEKDAKEILQSKAVRLGSLRCNKSWRARLRTLIHCFVQNDQVHTLFFPPTLNGAQRRFVHGLGSKHQLSHQSAGEGSDRYLVVRKAEASIIVREELEEQFLAFSDLDPEKNQAQKPSSFSQKDKTSGDGSDAMKKKSEATPMEVDGNEDKAELLELDLQSSHASIRPVVVKEQKKEKNPKGVKNAEGKKEGMQKGKEELPGRKPKDIIASGITQLVDFYSDAYWKEPLETLIRHFEKREDASVLIFSPHLNSMHRMMVHNMGDTLKLAHFSSGKGAKRHVVLAKPNAPPSYLGADGVVHNLATTAQETAVAQASSISKSVMKDASKKGERTKSSTLEKASLTKEAPEKDVYEDPARLLCSRAVRLVDFYQGDAWLVPARRLLETFAQKEEVAELRLPASINGLQRKELHTLANELGLSTRSQGSGKRRHLVVNKEEGKRKIVTTGTPQLVLPEEESEAAKYIQDQVTDLPKLALLPKNYPTAISAFIHAFVKHPESTELWFPTTLDNQQRQYVHVVCEELKLPNKSYFRGPKRRACVARPGVKHTIAEVAQAEKQAAKEALPKPVLTSVFAEVGASGGGTTLVYLPSQVPEDTPFAQKGFTNPIPFDEKQFEADYAKMMAEGEACWKGLEKKSKGKEAAEESVADLPSVKPLPVGKDGYWELNASIQLPKDEQLGSSDEEEDVKEKYAKLPGAHSDEIEMEGDPIPDTDNEVYKKVLKAGQPGMTPIIGSTCVIHYIGTLSNGTEFDNTRVREQPFKFTLGGEMVIMAWEKLLPTMHVGEIARMTTRSSFAYGKLGCPPRVPPAATLIFEVELIRFEDIANSIKNMGTALDFETLLAVARQLREEGNRLYRKKHFRKSLKSFARGIYVSRLREKERPEELRESFLKIQILLNMNAAACHLQLGEQKKGVQRLKFVLSNEGDNAKALLRLARLYLLTSDIDKALPPLRRACELAPDNISVKLTVKKFRELKAQELARKRRFTKHMFSGVFSDVNKRARLALENDPHLGKGEDFHGIQVQDELKLASVQSNTAVDQVATDLALASQSL